MVNNINDTLALAGLPPETMHYAAIFFAVTTFFCGLLSFFSTRQASRDYWKIYNDRQRAFGRLEETTEILELVRKERATLESTVATLREANRGHYSAYNKLELMYKEKVAYYETAKVNLEEHAQKLGLAEEQIIKLKRDFEAASEAYQKQVVVAAGLELELNEARRYVIDAQKQIDAIEERATLAEKRLDNANFDLDTTRAQYTGLSARLDSAEKRLLLAEKVSPTPTSDFEELRQKYFTAESNIIAITATRDTIMADYNALTEKHRVLREDHASALERERKTALECINIQKDYEDFKNMADKNRSEQAATNVRLAKEIDRLKEVIDSKETGLALLRKEIDGLRDHLKSVGTKCEGAIQNAFEGLKGLFNV